MNFSYHFGGTWQEDHQGLDISLQEGFYYCLFLLMVTGLFTFYTSCAVFVKFCFSSYLSILSIFSHLFLSSYLQYLFAFLMMCFLFPPILVFGLLFKKRFLSSFIDYLSALLVFFKNSLSFLLFSAMFSIHVKKNKHCRPETAILRKSCLQGRSLTGV